MQFYQQRTLLTEHSFWLQFQRNGIAAESQSNIPILFSKYVKQCLSDPTEASEYVSQHWAKSNIGANYPIK
jgi:hypothetical protein